MRLLLDSHVAIWALISPKVIPERIGDLMADLENDIYVSAASVWEIAIKFSRGKTSAPPFSGHDASRYFQQAGYLSLAVSAEHGAAAGALPPLHADPFDRMLIAQALTEPLRLITADRQVAAYSDTIIFF